MQTQASGRTGFVLRGNLFGLQTVFEQRGMMKRKFKGWRPDFGWKWLKWTFGFWSDPANNTVFGIDFGPLEIVWRFEGYRP